MLQAQQKYGDAMKRIAIAVRDECRMKAGSKEIKANALNHFKFRVNKDSVLETYEKERLVSQLEKMLAAI